MRECNQVKLAKKRKSSISMKTHQHASSKVLFSIKIASVSWDSKDWLWESGEVISTSKGYEDAHYAGKLTVLSQKYI